MYPRGSRHQDALTAQISQAGSSKDCVVYHWHRCACFSAIFSGEVQEQQAEIWVAMGTGSNLRYEVAHEISRSLNPIMSKSLPVFHAYTGHDRVSCFAKRGKKTAFSPWRSYPTITDAFLEQTMVQWHQVNTDTPKCTYWVGSQKKKDIQLQKNVV